MENKILEFVDILNKGTQPGIRSSFILKGEYRYTDRSTYRVANIGADGYVKLIELDEEDIAYFKNKYIPKLQNELNDKIDKLKSQYSVKITE